MISLRFSLAAIVSASWCSLAMADASSAALKQSVILVTPEVATGVHLLDENGKKLHSWQGKSKNAGGARLIAGGAVLRVIEMGLEPTFKRGGARGGGLEILEKDGTVRWQFWNSTTEHMTVGDALLLPNGNVLTAILEWKSFEDAALAGRDDALLDLRGFYVPGLMEIKPTGKTRGIPVWKWSVWDHLYQQRDPALNSYSKEAKSGCVDIATSSQRQGPMWLSPHELDYCPSLDMVVLTIRETGQAWVIDHSTSQMEALSDQGGSANRGGRILQRLPTENPNEGLTGRVASARWIEGAPDLILQLADGAQVLARKSMDHSTWSYDPQNKIAGALSMMELGGKKFYPVETCLFSNGDKLVSSGFWGLIARFTPEGKELWSVRNEDGKIKYKTKKSPPQETAPVSQIRIYKAFQ